MRAGRKGFASNRRSWCLTASLVPPLRWKRAPDSQSVGLSSGAYWDLASKLSLHIGLSAQFAQAFRDARLPTGTRSFPTLNDVNGKPDGDELTRIRRARTSTFVHDSARQRLVGELRQILVFMSTNDMRIDLGKVRLQSTARGGLSHGR